MACIFPFSQDYEIRIKNLQEEVERHSMMSSIITVSDLTSELEQVEGKFNNELQNSISYNLQLKV